MNADVHNDTGSGDTEAESKKEQIQEEKDETKVSGPKSVERNEQGPHKKQTGQLDNEEHDDTVPSVNSAEATATQSKPLLDNLKDIASATNSTNYLVEETEKQQTQEKESCDDKKLKLNETEEVVVDEKHSDKSDTPTPQQPGGTLTPIDVDKSTLSVAAEVDRLSINSADNEFTELGGFPIPGSNTSLSMSQSPSLASSLSTQLVDALLKSPDSHARLSCEMCANYEIQLQHLQESEQKLKQQLSTSQHLADRYRTELSGERLFRNELESKMTNLSAEATKQIESLTQQMKETQAGVEMCNTRLVERITETSQELTILTEKREESEEELAGLRREYEKLLGSNRRAAETMQQEAIDLPQTVEDLHLLVLQLREELIETRAAKEHLEETFKGEVAALKEQVSVLTEEKAQLEDTLSAEVNGLRTELGVSRSQLTNVQLKNKRIAELEHQIQEYQTTIGDLETKLESLQTEKGELDFQVTEYRKKTLILQHEMDTSEAVQRDFVKLSQNLQIELEKIRQAEQEVRWQDSEDAVICSNCKQPFSKQRVKHHCRHCGKIFCDPCLPRSVPSGPHRRPAKVCDVCYTLLVRDTAPYFSESVPNNSS